MYAGSVVVEYSAPNMYCQVLRAYSLDFISFCGVSIYDHRIQYGNYWLEEELEFSALDDGDYNRLCEPD